MTHAKYKNPGVQDSSYFNHIRSEKNEGGPDEADHTDWEHTDLEIPIVVPTKRYFEKQAESSFKPNISQADDQMSIISDAWLFHFEYQETSQTKLDDFIPIFEKESEKKQEKDVEEIAGFLSAIDDGDLEKRVKETHEELNESLSSRIDE